MLPVMGVLSLITACLLAALLVVGISISVSLMANIPAMSRASVCLPWAPRRLLCGPDPPGVCRVRVPREYKAIQPRYESCPGHFRRSLPRHVPLWILHEAKSQPYHHAHNPLV
ncbi:hypothetical protein F5Y07DRAFT_354715 [Xylaria sp. FL0933]|nr:hypothetical protein F5Y07DRAFT_354715 [Xylaria sp. FL0933]